MLKATVVIILSAVLAFSALAAIRARSKSLAVRGGIAGLALIVLVIVLRPEKGN